MGKSENATNPLLQAAAFEKSLPCRRAVQI
jgi:hypothetical protein